MNEVEQAAAAAASGKPPWANPENLAKGGLGTVVVALLFWQMSVGQTATMERLNDVSGSLNVLTGTVSSLKERVEGISDRIGSLEQQAAVSEALRERDEQDKAPGKR